MKKNYSYQKNEFKLIILYKFFLFCIIKKLFKFIFLEILIKSKKIINLIELIYKHLL